MNAKRAASSQQSSPDVPPNWQTQSTYWPAWLEQARIVSVTLWRGVEAQHRVATLKVVDTLDEQETLEDLLEESKPALPPDAGRMHYLLVTPFRYASPWPSRFRSPHEPGIWYGARELRTACVEVGYWRWRFAADSDAFGDEPVVGELTFFPARVRGRATDLTAPPWSDMRAAWMHPSDYGACHALAKAAREASVDWIRYASVRDPQHGACGAVLRPGVLQAPDLTRQQTWTYLARPGTVVMKPTALDSDEQPLEFRFAAP